MCAGQRGYVGHPPVAVTGHHDVVLHRLFSHPFPKTGSRSRSIARKVPGRTSPACWATVVRAVTSVPSARVARGLVLAVGTALAQQDTSVALDEPHDLPGCHQYSLATNHFKCLASKHYCAQHFGPSCSSRVPLWTP